MHCEKHNIQRRVGKVCYECQREIINKHDDKLLGEKITLLGKYPGVKVFNTVKGAQINDNEYFNSKTAIQPSRYDVDAFQVWIRGAWQLANRDEWVLA